MFVWEFGNDESACGNNAVWRPFSTNASAAWPINNLVTSVAILGTAFLVVSVIEIVLLVSMYRKLNVATMTTTERITKNVLMEIILQSWTDCSVDSAEVRSPVMDSPIRRAVMYVFSSDNLRATGKNITLVMQSRPPAKNINTNSARETSWSCSNTVMWS